MPKDMIPSRKNQALRSNAPTTEVLRITGMSSYGDNLKALARANDDWNLSPEQVVANGKANRKIYRIRFANKPVRFETAEENSDTTHVLILDHIIGILDKEGTDKLKQLISASDIHGITCVIQGGLYKIVDDACNVEVKQKGISAVIKITHQPKAAAVPVPAGKPSSGKQQKKVAGSKSSGKKARKKEKKPFYKRAWVWVLAALLALGSCGNETDTTLPAENTIPATTITQTEAIPETTTPATTEIVTTEAHVMPTTVPATEPTVETTAAPYVAPVAEEAPTQYVAPVVEDEEITVYLSSTGTKYHSKPNCGRMKNGTPVSLDTALKRNFEACKNCH